MDPALLTILQHRILPLLAGWTADLAFGDPVRLPHPVVGFGRLIAAGEKTLNRGRHRVLKGALLAIGLTLGIFLLGWSILRLCGMVSPWLRCAVSSLLIFYCLAGKTLRKEVRDVFAAVDRSLDEGRRQVSRIVGRDTASLSAQEVRTAALETLAENLSDGVVAPLFWLAVGGVPGMLAYKMVNTLDSMIGYRSDRYLLFGRTAARIDDAANWLPARLTAFMMIVCAGRPGLLRFVLHFGPQHASPNSGWPEAALAGVLNCRFGGTHDYFGQAVYKPYIGTGARLLTTADMRVALRINLRVEILTITTLCLIFLLTGIL